MSNGSWSSFWPEWKQVGNELGHGSYGHVYKVVRKDNVIETYSAIKVISIPSSDTELKTLRAMGLTKADTKTYLKKSINNFTGEVKTMVNLAGSKYIVNIKDYKVVTKSNGSMGADIYIRMELLESLSDHFKEKKVTESEAIKLGIDICEALETCSKWSVIHRDIKPDNIFYDSKCDHFKLGDFGIAKVMSSMTGGMSRKGTPMFMAPEISHSSHYDARVDIYSLGLVLYWLLNGQRIPFLNETHGTIEHNTLEDCIDRRLKGKDLPKLRNIKTDLCNVILKACDCNPAKRFQTAKDFKEALIAVQNGNYKHVSMYTDTEQLNKTVRVDNHAKPAYSSTTDAVPHYNTADKRTRFPTRLLTIIAIAVLVIGATIAVPTVFGSEGFGNKYSKQDREKINETLETAEELAGNKDYEGALRFVKASLVTYPESDKLLDKEVEYTISASDQKASEEDYEGALTLVKGALSSHPDDDALLKKEESLTEALAVQQKTKTLAEADELARNGDYLTAINMLEQACKKDSSDTDYAKALDNYCKAFKESGAATAEELANQGDYLAANAKIKEVISAIGEDNVLSAKAKTYEDAYVSEVVAQAEELLSAEQYNEADELIGNAQKEFKNNTALRDEAKRIADSRPVGADVIMKTLNENCISNSGTYKAYLGADTINAFAEEQHNAFSINTAASYNLWGGEQQNTVFRVSTLKLSTLSFTVSGETGCSGKVTISIYMDKAIDSGAPDYVYELEDASLPVQAKIDVDGHSTMAIKVNNHAGHENRIVFYGFEGK